MAITQAWTLQQLFCLSKWTPIWDQLLAAVCIQECQCCLTNDDIVARCEAPSRWIQSRLKFYKIGFAVKADFWRLWWFSVVMSECQQRATDTVTIAPRWKHLWCQHGITGGTLAHILARTDLRICSQTANPIAGMFVMKVYKFALAWNTCNIKIQGKCSAFNFIYLAGIITSKLYAINEQLA